MSTLLKRIGNKSKLAPIIISHFPKHDFFVDAFCGALGIFMHKTLAKYNVINDNDADVYNLYCQLMRNKEELYHQLEIMPISQDLFNFWRDGNRESCDLLNAVRFVFLSNYSFFGGADSLRLDASNTKKILLAAVEKTFLKLYGVQVINKDFRQVLPSIQFKNPKNAFVYFDPPYINTGDNYASSFKEQDSLDLFEIMANCGIKCAMSEFANPFILEQANKNGFRVIEIGERQTLKSRNTEILVLNYDDNQLKLF